MILAGASLLFLSCAPVKQTNIATTPLFETKWLLKKIYSEKGEWVVNTNAFLRLNEAKKTAGGNGSCNSFGSTTTILDNAISFKNIFSTKMYCEGVQQTEDAFFKQLGKVNSFETKGRSLLLYEGKNIVLEFSAE